MKAFLLLKGIALESCLSAGANQISYLVCLHFVRPTLKGQYYLQLTNEFWKIELLTVTTIIIVINL